MSAHVLFAIQLAVDALALLALVLILIKSLKEPVHGPIPCIAEFAQAGCAFVAAAGAEYSGVDEWQANDPAALLARRRIFSHRGEGERS